MKIIENATRDEQATCSLPIALVAQIFLAVSAVLLGQSVSDWWQQRQSLDRESGENVYGYAIDLRTASIAEMQLVPGFGQNISQLWIDRRPELLDHNSNSLDAIASLPGVGDSKVSQLKPYLDTMTASGVLFSNE